MQKLIITCNVTRDAAVNNVNGRKAVNFNVDVNEKWKDVDGTKQEKTTFYSCTMWRDGSQSTEIAKYIKKGTKVLVEGKPSAELYKNKDNKTAIDMRLNVSSVELLSKVETETENTNANANGGAQNGVDDFGF